MKTFISQLEKAFLNPLPGEDAHSEMMGYKRPHYSEKHISENTKEGAVLLVFYSKKDEIYFPLTQRHDYNGVHSGQVSLPGGKREQNESLKTTALRETEEEIGLRRENITVLGQLTPLYIPPSNFIVHPFVGYSSQNQFVKDDVEVKEIIETPIQQVTQPTIKETSIPMSGNPELKIKVQYFDIQSKVVWGATAMVLNEFRVLVDSS